MLPGLAPNHTRASFGSASRLYVENYAATPDDFVRVEDTGLWLLPAEVAERDRQAGIVKLSQQAENQTSAGMDDYAEQSTRGATILGKTAITTSGCMVDGIENHDDPNIWAMHFAEREWGGLLLDSLEDMSHLRICGCEDCYNTRHFDLDFGRIESLEKRKIEVNPQWYVTQQDGSIKTIWGDKLPSIEESLAYFIKFQKRHYPYVAYEKSKLSPSGVSNVRFSPVNGCWEAWKYYTKPEDNVNWQFDGYGRLYQKHTITKVDPETGEVIKIQRRGHWMAHRVIWNAMGRKFKDDRVLNHLCSHRRCCNPLHIKQETLSQNTNHGRRVQAAIRRLQATNPDAKDYYLSAEELVPYHAEALKLYHQLESKS